VTYTETRLQDIEQLGRDSAYRDKEFQDKIRIFSGDNLARQFK